MSSGSKNSLSDLAPRTTVSSDWPSISWRPDSVAVELLAEADSDEFVNSESDVSRPSNGSKKMELTVLKTTSPAAARKESVLGCLQEGHSHGFSESLDLNMEGNFMIVFFFPIGSGPENREKLASMADLECDSGVGEREGGIWNL